MGRKRLAIPMALPFVLAATQPAQSNMQPPDVPHVPNDVPASLQPEPQRPPDSTAIPGEVLPNDAGPRAEMERPTQLIQQMTRVAYEVINLLWADPEE